MELQFNFRMPTLTYFQLHGRAEAIRMLAHHAKVQFDDVKLSFEEWGAKKGAGEYTGQLPQWSNNGEIMTQSNAILKMLAHEHGLMPKCALSTYRAERLHEIGNDLQAKGHMKALFTPDGFTEETLKAFMVDWNATMALFEEHFAKHEFAAGDHLTWADFNMLSGALSGFLNHNEKHANMKNAMRDGVKAYPKYEAYIHRMKDSMPTFFEGREEYWI